MKTDLTQKQNTAIAIKEETENLIKASIAPNTIKAYRRALAGLQDFLSNNSQEFSDNTLAAYLTQLHLDGKSPASIAIVAAAARWQLRNENKDYDLPVTARTLAGIRREGKDRGRGQVKGLDWQDTERVCAFAESDGTIIGLRDSAMIRLMSDCLLRISEVVAVDVSDLEDKTLIIRQSKTDQEGATVALYITTATRKAIKKYRDKADIHEGALFRRIRRGGHVQPDRLTDFAVRRIIQKRAANANVEGFIAGHSLRVGTAVSLAKAGATVVDMQVAGRWKSSQMPAHYAKAELAERGAIARYKEKEE